MTHPREGTGKRRGRWAPLGTYKGDQLRQAILVGPGHRDAIWRVTVDDGSWYEVRFLDLPHVVVELLQCGLTIDSVARKDRTPDRVPGAVTLTTLTGEPA